MNFFKEGERLKAIFDNLVKQHKKSKRRVVDNKNVSKEMVQEYEENRLRLTHFFKMHSRFIRPRKNSVGIFSIDDFVKARTEAVMLSSKEGLGTEERARMGFSVGMPMDWNRMNDRVAVNYGMPGGGPLYMPGVIPDGRWGVPMEQGMPIWMGPMGQPIIRGQERASLWNPMPFPRQSEGVGGFHGVQPHGVEYRGFNGVYGGYGMYMEPRLRDNGQHVGLGMEEGNVYGMYGGFPSGCERNRFGERYRVAGKTVVSPKTGFSYISDERGVSGARQPTNWVGGGQLYSTSRKKEEAMMSHHTVSPGNLSYINGIAPEVCRGNSFATTCSLYPEVPGKRRCSAQHPQSPTNRGEVEREAVEKVPEDRILDEIMVGSDCLEKGEMYSCNLEDLWRLDILLGSEKEQGCDGIEKNEIELPKDLQNNNGRDPNGELCNVNGNAGSDVKTIEELIGCKDIDKDVKAFIYELCDGFVDHIIHMSCALAYHRKKDVVELCDVKLALKTEVGIEVPEDDEDLKNVSTESKEKR
ncbi:transcription initiation factor TFIID subunit TAF12 [Encephalitozoon hellem]|uniref:Transcription initiation factor TFIID subunit TAF12 n=1 Tax=Encephalitozoon hellem TaxID=27973 RepID=A0ABY8CL66_ENCHE|nr:transcription initiation factor TFIID subunit TAF12 [Encephalitozoon hellem]